VVDVVESTRLAHEFGETALLKSLWHLAEVFEQAARSQDVLYLKCTGDGFLATFDDAARALAVASQVLSYFRAFHPEPRAAPLRLRFALHRGRVRTDERGERGGLAVHLCVRLKASNSRRFPSREERWCYRQLTGFFSPRRSAAPCPRNCGSKPFPSVLSLHGGFLNRLPFFCYGPRATRLEQRRNRKPRGSDD
jgi:hypothetical protein